MTDYNRPDSVPAWAESGDKVQPTNAELQVGWPLTNVPPSRQRFNWLLNWLSNAVRYFLQIGVSEWNEAETYRTGSRVQYDGLTYVSLVDDNAGNQPDTSTVEWERWAYGNSDILPRVDSLLTKSVAGSSNVTLTAAEANNGILVFTGTLTGDINVILPNAARRWAIHNGTSGSYKLSVKTSSGTAVELKQGKSVTIYCDGANTMRLSGNTNDTAIEIYPFTATAGQTSFSLTYDSGSVFQVSRNGVLVPFTATSGTAVVLTTAAAAGDEVKVFVASSFQLADAYTKSESSALFVGKAAGTALKSTFASSSTHVAITAITPMDNTKPQYAEGEAVMSASITPSSASSKIRVSATIPYRIGGGNTASGVFHLHNGTTSDAFAAVSVQSSASNETSDDNGVAIIVDEFVAGTTSAITINLRAGREASGDSFEVNPEMLGGTVKTVIILEEIQA